MAMLMATAKLLNDGCAKPGICLCQCMRMRSLACSALQRPTVQQRCLGTCARYACRPRTHRLPAQRITLPRAAAQLLGRHCAKPANFASVNAQRTRHKGAADHPADCSWQQRTCGVGAAPSQLLLCSGLVRVTGRIQAQWTVLP